MSRISTVAMAAAVASSSFLTVANAQSGPYTVSDATTTRTYTITQDTGGDIPLASKHFQYPDLPYKADSGDGPRGTQQGYNLCNSTTLGPDSFCQTAIINSIDDFCIWGAPFANVTVGEDEEQLVAYCTTADHGTRVLPPGALTGIQFTKTPGYAQVVGFLDQTALGLLADDYGGEEDPHGADQRGNPLGGLLYSTAFGSSGSSNYTQVIEWSYFVGGGSFCFKACDPAGPDAARLCEHIYDRIGCTYNAPADYASINGTFTSCQGDNQLPAGIYVEDGQTKTYTQPDESLGPITSIPYTASIPASSQCSTFSSDALYTAIAAYASSSGSPAASGATSAPTSSASTASTGPARGAAAAAASGARTTGAASPTGAAGKSTAVAGASLLLAGLVGVVALLA